MLIAPLQSKISSPLTHCQTTNVIISLVNLFSCSLSPIQDDLRSQTWANVVDVVVPGDEMGGASSESSSLSEDVRYRRTSATQLMRELWV